ncbi:MAG: NAD-dependent epimerase/dehydratase family protein [Bacteroidota bacterium]
MKQRISILGCGWLGSALAEELHEQGYRVFGSSRSSATQLEGIQHFVVDISKSEQDHRAFLASDTLIIAIPSKDVDGFKGLIAQIERSEIKQVLFVSSTSVYPLSNGIVSEESATQASPLAAIEQLFVRNKTFATTILRFGGLFGYNRQPGNFFKPGRQIKYPEGYVNLIHRDDCIGIMQTILEQNLWGQVLNACADEHPTRRAFYTRAAQKVGRTDLSFDEEAETRYKIVSSQKLKDLLGYEFKYGNLMEL